MSIVLYILLAVLILLFMITVHELGHYTAGKILGFKIDEFAIGFGPKLYSHTSKKTGEVFSIRAFPLGGFCAFNGEEAGSENDGAFAKQAPWKRIIVLFSGAFFNFLTAIIFSFILLVSVGYDIPKIYTVADVSQIENVRVLQEGTVDTYIEGTINSAYTVSEIYATTPEGDVVIYEYAEGKTKYTANYIPALINNCLATTPDQLPRDTTFNCFAKVKNNETEVKYSFTANILSNKDKIKVGDVVYKVNNTKVNVLHPITSIIQDIAKTGTRVATLEVQRGEDRINITVDILESGLPDKDGNYSYVLGVNTEPYRHTFLQALGRAVPLTLEFSWLVLKTLFQLVTGQVAMSAVGGTITTIFVMADYAKQNLKTILVLIPLIASNLAVFNWLPIPALDGAHIVFTIIEWIRKKPVNPKVENMIHTIGLYVLLGFVVFADIYQLIIHLIH